MAGGMTMESFWEGFEPFGGDISYVNREIIKQVSVFSPHPLAAASRHLVEVGGKRIRPLLVILSFRSLDQKRDITYAAPIAVAVELIHTATLIHDDIIDRSSKRRGVETVFKKWGEVAAILSGDLLFSRAFGLVGTHEIKELTEVISDTCIKLSEGEMLEYRHTGNTDMTEEVYLEIVERKTACLFEACTRCGALLGRGDREVVECLARFGRYLGISFQMVDDILDITGGDRFGKPMAIDIREGKVTIAALHALKHTSGGDRKTLESIIKKKRKSKKDIDVASEIIKGAGSIEYASKRAEWFSKKAEAELGSLPDSEAKAGLVKIARNAIYRPF
ncbi:MAG: polyprenyl synthetase family protein [Methanobacteriota archaeon]|nr:MAG: polyprenyl synthetase family protein [Euryarchaeota archaeon]